MGEWGKRSDMVVHEVEPVNAEAPLPALDAAQTTSNNAFFMRNHGVIPSIDPRSWRLRVVGMVGRQLELSLPELRARFPRHEVVATLQCAGNRRSDLIEYRAIPGETPWGSGATSTARWGGARLADVLAAADLAPDAAHIAFDAPDIAFDASPPQGFGASVPVDKALAGETLLVWEMNGEPLPRVHGGPVRVVVPGYIGARSVKWIETIRASDSPSDNYFQASAYRVLPGGADPAHAPVSEGQLGPVPINTDILHPEDGAIVAAGPLIVTGYAFAGEALIEAVEVSADGGQTWVPARLDPQRVPWEWRKWTVTLDVQPATSALLARARDVEGRIQPERTAEVWNPKGYANNAWARVRISVKM